MQRIKSVGILSCAKMLGVLYGCLGLLFYSLRPDRRTGQYGDSTGQ